MGGLGSRSESKSNGGSSHSATGANKSEFSKAKVPVNYLAKVIKNKDVFLRKKDAYVQKARVFFKFNEGYSNAVRKRVKMSEFL